MTIKTWWRGNGDKNTTQHPIIWLVVLTLVVIGLIGVLVNLSGSVGATF